MKSRALLAAALAVLAGSSSCDRSSGGTAESERRAALGGDVAARVGVDTIPLAMVAKVAAAQQVSPREALNRLVDDAISANGARERQLERKQPAAWQLTAARARWLADRTLEAARTQGAPTDAEITELTLRHWREVDRPPAVRVVHVLVMRPKDASGAPAARALAERLRGIVVPAADEADFTAKAKAAEHPAELEVRVESLPAFASDGFLVDQEGGMLEAFAQAAFAIPALGGTSPVTETRFGWHVIRLLERLPEQRMPLDARRAAFAQEAVIDRAHKESDAQLTALRAANPIMVEPSAENLMQSLFARDTLGAGRSP